MSEKGAAMATEFTDEELRELYEVLNRCQQALKHQEQARAALDFTDKPAPYSPLVQRLMVVRNDVGEKVAQLPPEPQG
jgi:hypothetical protein